jgi:hypothetical protein
MSWLLVIAQLCQISVATGSNWSKDSERMQVQCQKELITCYRANKGSADSDNIIADCVLKRNP